MGRAWYTKLKMSKRGPIWPEAYMKTERWKHQVVQPHGSRYPTETKRNKHGPKSRFQTFYIYRNCAPILKNIINQTDLIQDGGLKNIWLLNLFFSETCFHALLYKSEGDTETAKKWQLTHCLPGHRPQSWTQMTRSKRVRSPTQLFLSSFSWQTVFEITGVQMCDLPHRDHL